MFHYAKPKKQKQLSSVQSSKFTLHRSFFQKDSLRVMSSITRLFPSSAQRRQPPLRIDLTVEGSECLERIFAESMINPPFANLQTFLIGVHNSNLIQNILGEGRASVIVYQVSRLAVPGACDQFVTWPKLEELLVDKTLLNFPIRQDSASEWAEYNQLMIRNGVSDTAEHSVDIEEHAMVLEESFKDTVSDKYLGVQKDLEFRWNKVTKTEESEQCSSRIDILMELAEQEKAKAEEEKKPDRSEQLCSARFTPLTSKERSLVENVLNGPKNQDVLITKFNTPMDRSKITCLRPNSWLNDEVRTVHTCHPQPYQILSKVINFYMCMLKERDTELCTQTPDRLPSHFFNSFFMERLMISNNGYEYSNIRRWTKKVDVFGLDKVFFPVNLSNTHWTLLVVFITRKEIHYYDSMNGNGKRFLEGAKKWLIDEYKDKKNGIYDVSNWLLVDKEKNIPQQANGVDCGMFTTICADFLSDDLPLKYGQTDMPFFRRRVTASVLNGSLNYPV